MQFSLDEFLISVSFALDFVEMDILGRPSNHGKRSAYISLKIAEELGLSEGQMYDILALAILHDNGISERNLHEINDGISLSQVERIKEHCVIGENNLQKYPFITDVSNVIKYHHEKYDGSGFFGLMGEETPLLAQIIQLADAIDTKFRFNNMSPIIKGEVIEFVKEEDGKTFSPMTSKAFLDAQENEEFWSELGSDRFNELIKSMMPYYSKEMSFEEIHEVTKVFSKIIDAKSKFTERHSKGLSEKVEAMADFYGIKGDEKMKLIISADLHDLGKLAVPNSILDKPGKLNKEEFGLIRKHTYYTRIALEQIKGFEDITEWASNHHEKLNGTGYPFGMTSDKLDFNSRLLACLDIYEALTEERPYRTNLNHMEAINIMKSMQQRGEIDGTIIKDINEVFGK